MLTRRRINKLLTNTVGVLSLRINSGEEYRDVDCAWHFDYDEGIKSLVREDTGEVIKTEKISDFERQEKLGV